MKKATITFREDSRITIAGRNTKFLSLDGEPLLAGSFLAAEESAPLEEAGFQPGDEVLVTIQVKQLKR